jgi:hypothetical protein
MLFLEMFLLMLMFETNEEEKNLEICFLMTKRSDLTNLPTPKALEQT